MDQKGPGRLGCALQPIACGISGGRHVYLPLCSGIIVLYASLVNNSVVNKVCVDVCISLVVLCGLAVDPWD